VKRGETVRCIVDYDLFDLNIKGKEGCLVKEDEKTGKFLVHFPENGEWAELRREQFEPVNAPGYIPEKNKKFVKNVKTLEYTY